MGKPDTALGPSPVLCFGRLHHLWYEKRMHCLMGHDKDRLGERMIVMKGVKII
jgi:hypothetical protein